MSDGSCMGFSIRSSFPLRYLRSGAGDQKMELVEGPTEGYEGASTLQEWPSSRGEPSLRLLEEDSRLIVENDLMGRFEIDRDRGRITVPTPVDVPPALREAFMWSTPFAVAGTDRDHVVIHAAAVDVNGSGILIAGDTRTGKTTLAGAFHAAGHRLLSDDGARCHVASASVYPGPALLRLRPDMAASISPDDFDLVHRTRDKVHLTVPSSRRGDGRSIQISAIVFLNWGDHTLEPVRSEAALSRLWPLVFYLPFEGAAGAAFESLAKLVGSTSAYEMHRPRSESETFTVVDRLIDSCLG